MYTNYIWPPDNHVKSKKRNHINSPKTFGSLDKSLEWTDAVNQSTSIPENLYHICRNSHVGAFEGMLLLSFSLPH